MLYKNICYKLYLAHRKTHKIFFNVNLIFQYLVLKYISQTFYTNFYRFLHEFSFFVIISSVNYMVLIQLVLLYCLIPFTFAHWKTLKWQILKCTNIYYYCSPLFWYSIWSRSWPIVNEEGSLTFLTLFLPVPIMWVGLRHMTTNTCKI